MPPYTGEVNITVLDAGAAIVAVPAASVQAVIGTAGSGTVNAVIATRSPATIASTFSSGPLMQASGMALQSSLVNAGGVGPTVLAVRAATATAGSILGSALSPLSVAGATALGGLVEIETSAPHGLTTGWTVTITGVVGTTEANTTKPVTIVDSTHFTIPVTFVNAYVSGGSVQPLGTIAGTIVSGVFTPGTPGGTSVITFTGTPTDRYFIEIKVVTGGTIGAAGIILQISYDAGRNFGPQIALGTATTLALGDSGGLDTGVTANFAAGTLVANDFARCSTVAPAPNAAGIQAAIAALASYANLTGTVWGSMHICGALAGSDATTIETTLDNLATNSFVYTRAIIETRDASPPAAWGGTGESGATWAAAVLSDFSAVTARRISPAAGFYNMPSAFPTYKASVPSYRQSLGYAYAARECVIAPQVHAGRVKDGSLSQIVVNPNVDPSDGFVYWDSASSPTLDYFLPGGAGRFATARTRQSLAGYFISNPLTLAPVGSSFSLLPRGLTMDVGCTITHSALEQFVNADIQTAANGTLLDKDANDVRNAVSKPMRAFMLNVGMISGFTVVPDQSNNIQATSTLIVTITIQGVAYILQETVTIAFADQLAA